MKPGDLVKMKQGYSALGIVVSTPDCDALARTQSEIDPVRWVRILWSDHGRGVEKERDLKVVDEAR